MSATTKLVAIVAEDEEVASRTAALLQFPDDGWMYVRCPFRVGRLFDDFIYELGQAFTDRCHELGQLHNPIHVVVFVVPERIFVLDSDPFFQQFRKVCDRYYSLILNLKQEVLYGTEMLGAEMLVYLLAEEGDTVANLADKLTHFKRRPEDDPSTLIRRLWETSCLSLDPEPSEQEPIDPDKTITLC